LWVDAKVVGLVERHRRRLRALDVAITVALLVVVGVIGGLLWWWSM
jgi:hypothetical protein